MAKSGYVAALDTIQGGMTDFLNPLGFRKSGRTYNRSANDGLVHVVNFQMGAYPIGDYVIPGLRESLYGRFTVNLGVMLPAVRDIESLVTLKGFVQDSHCEIRGRLGSFAHPGEDVWWDLDVGVKDTGSELVRRMDQFGLPFLNQYEDYASVLCELDRVGELPSKNSGRSALVGALICHRLGRDVEACKWFDRATADAATLPNKGFQSHVADLRQKCGL